MYVRRNEMGFIEPVTSAIFSIASLKNLFGIGKKKRARAANVEQNKGLYTDQFPPGTDFTSTLTLTPAATRLAKEKGGKTLADDYDAMFDHKDSWLVKNGVASAEDYAAYTILKSIEQGNPICDPMNRKPNALLYKRCPTLNGENLFVALEKQQAPPPPPVLPPTPAPVEPGPDMIDRIATALTPPAVPIQPAPVPTFATPPPVQVHVQPTAAAAPSAPAPAAGPPQWLLWGAPAAVVAAAAIFMLARPPAPRRRGRR